MLKKCFILFLFIFLFIGFKEVKASGVFADSYILIEKESLRVLDGEDIHKRLLPASITKIMTCIVAIENCDLDNEFVVTSDVIKQEGSSIYLKLGEKVSMKSLLYGMMLRSGNDAAYMIAKCTFGDYDLFISKMNEYCCRIGMKNSVFYNPSGLDDTTCNYSTAYDMAILMAYALDNETFRAIVSTKNYSYTSSDGIIHYFTNKHKLILSYDFITGGKTGYTKRAHRTLVTSAYKDSMELICVTFNCGNDWNNHLELFEYGFSNFKRVKVITEGIIKLDDNFYEAIPYLPDSIYIPLKNDEKCEVIVYLLNDPKELIIGKVCIYIQEDLIYSLDIYRYY